MKPRVAVVTGSFDPLTNGHCWTIEQCTKLFDETHVVVGHHPGKSPFFTPEERIQMIASCGICGPNLLTVEATTDVCEYYRKIAKTNTLYRIRSVRTSDEAHDEFDLAFWAKFHTNCEMTQMLYIAPDHLKVVSSTLVKAYAQSGLWEQIKKMVPKSTFEMLEKFYNRPLASVLSSDQASLGH